VKRFTPIFFFTLLPLLAMSQSIEWNMTPRKGFVFQINNKEAEKLLTRAKGDTIFHRLLHTQVDTFDVTKGWINRPAKGHFILASIVENKLTCEYTSVFPYQVFLLKEYDALTLQVLDLEGNVREDAVVKLKSRQIRIDQETKNYRLANEWFMFEDRIVSVELDGFRSVFKVKRHEVPEWDYDYYDDGPDFYSYMITDKNRYKPGEKVRYKSYALSQNRSPLRKTLGVWAGMGWKLKKIGTIEPHRPGSYAGDFVLHDSLKFILDKQYSLQLREKNGRIVSNSQFKYEDYELNGNKLEVRLATKEHYHPTRNEVTILATDDNGLILKDARATVVVDVIAIHETFQPLVILRDTVMKVEVDLDPAKATVVDIPSRLFEKTNTVYRVSVRALNSQNQAVEYAVSAKHYYSSYALNARFSNDSIIYEMEKNGASVNHVPFTLRHEGEVNARNVFLPHKEKINPVVSTVYLRGDSISRDISLDGLVPRLELKGGINKDSFNIRLDNPQKIDVSWFVYQGAPLLKKGFGKELKFDTLIIDRSETYYVELLYTFGGKEQIMRKEFEFRDAALNVALNIPERVFPGQKAEATVQVTDTQGAPVRDVDLTALGVTGKLNYYLPDLHYYGKKSSPRSMKNDFSKSNLNQRGARLSLDYKKWEKLAGLDTMKYYQFTYPGRGIKSAHGPLNAMFTHSIRIADSTQFAPYVMQNGVARMIYVIELNQIPVYYSWADQPKEYSFYTPASEKVSISLRLYDRVLLLDSMSFPRGKKTILSIDLDHLPGKVITVPIAPRPKRFRRDRKYYEFKPMEISRHSQYISRFKYVAGNAWLENGKGFTPLFRSWDPGPKGVIVAGPIAPGKQTFYSPRAGQQITYAHEGGYTYSFADNVVYKMNAEKLFPDQLFNHSLRPMSLVNDAVTTKKVFLEPVYAAARQTRSVDLVDRSINIKVLLPVEVAASGFLAILFRPCGSSQIMSPCQNRSIANIPRGCNSIIALYANGTYLVMDNVKLQSYTKVVVDLNKAAFQSADSLSEGWRLRAWDDCYSAPERRVIQMRHSITSANGNLKGAVFAHEDNSPLPGVNILVKGTTNGTVTDEDGKFALYTSESPVTLQISFIGFMTVEVETQLGADIVVYMEADVKQLTEVVVTGQGFSSDRRALGYSVSRLLQGRIPGVNITNDDVNEEKEPEEEATEAEKEEAERRLYSELLNISTIRSHFRDVAFWEPKLFTDKKGQSSFAVTFPDDITRWEATVYAMNRQLQVGTGRKIIKSYKPIMAQLLTPQFLTLGDSANFLGKVLNYSQDGTIAGKVKWDALDGFEKSVQFNEFHLDKLPVFASSLDSVKSSYLFTRDDGYLDGEERKVPVVEQGIVRAEGTLAVLTNKEEVRVKASTKEKVTVEVLADPLDILVGEAKDLINYRFDCNEQLASKLAGLVNYRMVMQYEGKPFKYDKDVNRIITRLLKNQNEEFLWSWWDVSPYSSLWMSAHILRSLKVAADAGYKVDLDIENLARKATYRFDILKNYESADADLLNALSSWNANLDYAKYLAKIEAAINKERMQWAARQRSHRRPGYSYLGELLLLQEIRLQRNLAYQRDSLLRYEKKGILGATQFSDGKLKSYWYRDDLSVNVIAYRMVKRDSLLKDRVVPMQLYFLGERSKGSWNTYHSSGVIMSVLPDLIAAGATKKQAAAIQMSGKINATVDKFPYRLDLLPGEEVTLRKESGVPAYFMQYTRERVTQAKTGVEGFEIKTTIGNNAPILEAGKAIDLTVEVNVKKDASFEYVMIEVPIPAACSYADKRSARNPVETHREYFKERTVIFCENMKAGKYFFHVKLLPRFTGKYILNPAQVSLMYIPVVNANTEMRKVRVE
jgi:hypothetical protein